MISKEYLAGLIDGEAWVGITNKTTPRIQIELGNSKTNKKVLGMIYNQYGGSLRIRNTRKYQIRLTFRKEETIKLINELFPYIIIKKEIFKMIKNL